VAAFSGPLIVQRFCDKTPFGMRVWVVFGVLIQLVGTALSALSFHITWMLLFGAFLRPVGESITFMIGITILQRQVPDHIRGRVFAFSGAFLTLGQACSGFTAGIVSDIFHINLHVVLFIFSAVNFVTYTIWLTYLLVYWVLRRNGSVSDKWNEINK
jgi:MFS family permease